ncbi:AAA family ATPase [Salipiger bermudensis]|uniref:AAA family ATPase n=1 Tax=Salipiger bermudensis TaxID=344736 RepID=UPI001CD4B272|nr:AAA family ATPase [Salipiger bermudensis]MCA1286935.1 AAA family ATPase [Salipiger bermudensis]
MPAKHSTKASKGQASDNRRAALALAAEGWHVIPLGPNKRPLVKGWQDKATDDARQIGRWWDKWPDAMPGLPSGERNGFTVLDIDQKNGKDGFAELKALGLDVDSMSPCQVETASGGRHIYFRWDGQGNSAAGLPAGLDVRGEGGFVVAPGAINGKGVYTGRLTRELPAWPEALPIRRKAVEPGQGEPTGLPFHVIRDALMACPNDGDAYASRDAWLHMVMAVHCETEGREEGREAVHEWSRQHHDYDSDHTDAVWDSCKADRGLTGWHIINEAERHQWRDDTVADLRAMQNREEAMADFDDLYQLMGWQPIYDDWDATELDEIDALVGGPSDRSCGLTFLSPSDCAATAARPYVIKGLIAQGDVAAIVGAPGAGKSLFAPRIGYAVAQGAEVFGRRVKAGGVFYVAAEDGHGMRGRVQAMEAEHGDAPDFKVVEGVTDLLTKQGQLKALQRAVKERRPALVVIDTLAVAFPGLEENDAKGMGQVVAAARSLTKWGAAVVLIHHDTKAGDGLPRGHSLLNGALDVALYLKKEDGGVSVKPSKNRNGTTEQELAFTVGVREIGTDEDGDAITAAICEEADHASRARSPQLTASARAALSVLRDLGRGTMHVPEESWRDACIGGREVSASDNADSRRKAFKRAVESLTREGVV